MTSENRTTYICGICNTKPDQLSHHNAHLNSITHKEQKIICEFNIRKYVVEFFYLLNDDYWRISILNEYLEARTCCESIPIFEDWIVEKDYEIYKKYNLNINSDINYWLDKYMEETKHTCNFNDNIDRILFLDWKIKNLIKTAETIQKTERSIKNNYFDNEIINKINCGELTTDQLIDKFLNELCFENCSNIEVEGNPNTTISKHKKCKINEINLGYVVYSNFKDKFVHKKIEVETIILGNSTKTNSSFWFINGEESVNNQIGNVCSLIRGFINEKISDNVLDNEKKLKIKQLHRRLFTPCTYFLSKLASLFTK